MLRTWLSVCLLLLTTACGAPLAPEVRDQIDRELDFATVLAEPERYRGRALLLGGSVVTLRSAGEESYLEIQRWEVNRWGEPLQPADSGDRFLVRSPRLLDSDLFTRGRLVTLAGTVSGAVNAGREETDERILLFDLLDIYLWNSPFRYGLRANPDPGVPEYVVPKAPGADQPYDPTPWTYPYPPDWYRNR